MDEQTERTRELAGEMREAYRREIKSLRAEVARLEEEVRVARVEASRDEQNAAHLEKELASLRAENERLVSALRDLGHEWCRDHCDGDQHTDACGRAIAALARREEQGGGED